MAQILAEAPSGAVTTTDLTAELMVTGQLLKSCTECGRKPLCSVTGQHQAGTQPEVLTCPASVSNLMSSSPAVQSCGIPVSSLCRVACHTPVLHMPPVGA